jgi:hypothetical protein
MEDVQAFGTPRAAQVGPVTDADLLAQFDAWVGAVDGCHWETRTRWLPALAAGIAAKAPRRHCLAPSLASLPRRRDADGAGWRRVRPAPSARDGGDRRGLDGAAHGRWAQDLWQSLAPFALPGGYANLLGPDDREQAAGAYGCNAARLRVLKRRFDPDGVFASAIPLPER